MLPLKLVRSLVLGETINHNPNILTQNHHLAHTHDNTSEDEEEEEANENHATSSQPHHQRSRSRRRKIRRRRRSKIPCLLFLPTKEIIRDTYRLASIARELGMDLYPTPSLSHIIFSNPSSTPSSSPSTPSSTSCSFSISSNSCSFQNDAVPIPFPHLSTTPLTHLRYFITLFPRAFKIVLFNSDHNPAGVGDIAGAGGIWDCCSLSLYSRVTGDRVETMEGFCRVLAGQGWNFFKTKKNPSSDQHGGGVYLFRKVDLNRVRVGRVGLPNGACRVRELRLPHLDFGNAPLRILQYILLMTDDIFCLA